MSPQNPNQPQPERPAHPQAHQHRGLPRRLRQQRPGPHERLGLLPRLRHHDPAELRTSSTSRTSRASTSAPSRPRPSGTCSATTSPSTSRPSAPSHSSSSPHRRPRPLKRDPSRQSTDKTASNRPATSLSGCSIRSSSSPSTSRTHRLLRLPYFWDEAGYYIPAAWDFFRTGTLIPQTTVTNAHPPLPSILLAAWWHLSGFVVSGTRTLVCMVTAAALLGVFKLAQKSRRPLRSPQSPRPHRDLPHLVRAKHPRPRRHLRRRLHPLGTRLLPRRPTAPRAAATSSFAALIFSLAALSKETAIITPVALALWEAILLLRNRREQRQQRRLTCTGSSLCSRRSSRSPPGTPITITAPASSSATPSSSATTPPPTSTPTASPSASGIASCT